MRLSRIAIVVTGMLTLAFGYAASAQQSAALAEEFPYLAEVVAGHVAEVGYDFATAFECGLDLILDALEARRVG